MICVSFVKCGIIVCGIFCRGIVEEKLEVYKDVDEVIEVSY